MAAAKLSYEASVTEGGTEEVSGAVVGDEVGVTENGKDVVDSDNDAKDDEHAVSGDVDDGGEESRRMLPKSNSPPGLGCLTSLSPMFTPDSRFLPALHRRSANHSTSPAGMLPSSGQFWAGQGANKWQKVRSKRQERPFWPGPSRPI